MEEEDKTMRLLMEQEHQQLREQAIALSKHLTQEDLEELPIVKMLIRQAKDKLHQKLKQKFDDENNKLKTELDEQITMLAKERDDYKKQVQQLNKSVANLA